MDWERVPVECVVLSKEEVSVVLLKSRSVYNVRMYSVGTFIVEQWKHREMTNRQCPDPVEFPVPHVFRHLSSTPSVTGGPSDRRCGGSRRFKTTRLPFTPDRMGGSFVGRRW